LQPAGTGRRLQASNNGVTLSVTISPLVQSAAEVEAATRALNVAVTGNPSATLPAGASLDTVLQILNKDLQQGGAERLLADVQKAIVNQGLTNVFNATLTNATQIAGARFGCCRVRDGSAQLVLCGYTNWSHFGSVQHEVVAVMGDWGLL
jgi:hypothetical protein